METLKTTSNKNAASRVACRFMASQMDSSLDSKKLRILARSVEPTEHWWWGNVIHDFSGMTPTKNRLPLDYDHDTGEVIGAVENFKVDNEGLWMDGELIPFKDDDRASEVIFRMGKGIPYEASIDFAGDGIEYECVSENQIATVNGKQFNGPLTVIRKFPLRGVAITPYGQDMNTQVAGFKTGETIALKNISIEQQQNKETCEMSKENSQVTPSEAPAAVKPAVEAPAVQSVEQSAPAAAASFKVDEFKSMVAKFGAEIAAKVVAIGGNETDALRFKNEALEAELAAAKKLAQSAPAIPTAAPATTTPATFSHAEGESKEKLKLESLFARK